MRLAVTGSMSDEFLAVYDLTQARLLIGVVLRLVRCATASAARMAGSASHPFAR